MPRRSARPSRISRCARSRPDRAIPPSSTDSSRRTARKKVALEDKTLTYAEFMSWSTALHATAVRLEDGVESLRMMKEDSEVEKIVAAQRIAEQALEEVLNDIRIGVTEKGDRRPPDLPHAALRRGKTCRLTRSLFRVRTAPNRTACPPKRPSRQVISSRWTSAASTTATVRI